jgi:hypothetical protein
MSTENKKTEAMSLEEKFGMMEKLMADLVMYPNGFTSEEKKKIAKHANGLLCAVGKSVNTVNDNDFVDINPVVETPISSVSVDAHVDAPVDAPVDIPVDAPVDAHVDAPVDIPVDAPVDDHSLQSEEKKVDTSGGYSQVVSSGREWQKIPRKTKVKKVRRKLLKPLILKEMESRPGATFKFQAHRKTGSHFQGYTISGASVKYTHILVKHLVNDKNAKSFIDMNLVGDRFFLCIVWPRKDNEHYETFRTLTEIKVKEEIPEEVLVPVYKSQTEDQNDRENFELIDIRDIPSKDLGNPKWRDEFLYPRYDSNWKDFVATFKEDLGVED